MLVNAAEFKGLAIHASDGELGTVEELYFDDESWGVRYLTVETGGWLGGRRVLISPYSVLATDWSNRRLDVALTKQQVEDSPNIDTQLPVSRQSEAGFLGYFGYPNYWGGPYLWGPAAFPAGFPLAVPVDFALPALGPAASPDSHLRMTLEVTGYHIAANDGEIGHLAAFLIDEEAWAIRYIEVATRNWWPGKKVLVAPAWIQGVNWPEATVSVCLSREAIQSAPEYLEGAPITREYEAGLHVHYGRPPYWLANVQETSASPK